MSLNYDRRVIEIPDGGLFIENLNMYVTGTRQIISGIHPETVECRERGCVIHYPSDHSMRDMRTHWRTDRGIMERICTHGVGHIDRDQMSYFQSLVEAGKLDQADADAEGVHGCCAHRCCDP